MSSSLNQTSTPHPPVPSPTALEILLRLVPTNPSAVSKSVSTYPHLATQGDEYGYTLVHAAASYNHPDLIRELVTTYGANVDVEDEEGDTPLFFAEQVGIARLLLEDLGADIRARNYDGDTFVDKLEGVLKEGVEVEGWEADMLAYLRGRAGPLAEGAAAASSSSTTTTAPAPATSTDSAADSPSFVSILPMVPNPQAMSINFSLVPESDLAAGEPDPEIRRRIEELVAAPPEAGSQQDAVRQLVTDIVVGMREQDPHYVHGGDRTRPRTTNP